MMQTVEAHCRIGRIRPKRKCVKDIFALWPTASALARDLDMNPITVRQWQNRNSIPAKDLLRIEASAQKRGIDITVYDLLRAIEAYG